MNASRYLYGYHTAYLKQMRFPISSISNTSTVTSFPSRTCSGSYLHYVLLGDNGGGDRPGVELGLVHEQQHQQAGHRLVVKQLPVAGLGAAAVAGST